MCQYSGHVDGQSGEECLDMEGYKRGSDTPLTYCPHERNFEVLRNCLCVENIQGILQCPSVRIIFHDICY